KLPAMGVPQPPFAERIILYLWFAVLARDNLLLAPFHVKLSKVVEPPIKWNYLAGINLVLLPGHYSRSGTDLNDAVVLAHFRQIWVYRSLVRTAQYALNFAVDVFLLQNRFAELPVVVS